MFDIFKNKEGKTDNKLLSNTASLLIHVAKIDQNFSQKEKEIIKKTLLFLGASENSVEKIIVKAENDEEQSNQILEFTREIKNADNDIKIKIVEALWTIIYSNNEADMYETSLMRRLSGLLYIEDKLMGNIKKKVKNNS